MAQTKKNRKIIWALDPFEKTGETTKELVENLKQLAGATGAKVEPVYVLSPDLIDVNLTYPDSWFKKYRPLTENVVNQYLKDLAFPNLLPPRILNERQASMRQATQTLLAYAKRAKAEMIAVGTHSRKGMSRFFMGSFAETVLLYSKVPVLVVGAQSLKKGNKGQKRMDHILFATDFTKNSGILFESILKLAASLHSRITILHAIPHPAAPLIQSGVYLLSGAWVTLPEFLTQEEERTRKLGARYEALARRKNVPLDVVIDSSHMGISEIILKNAETASLIAMAAESGMMKSLLIGSITRQVVRSAPCPVWVMRK